MIEKTQFPRFMFPQVVATLVRKAEITNDHLIAYSLSNISAINYQNRLMCVDVIVCYISVIFWRHSVVATTSTTVLSC